MTLDSRSRRFMAVHEELGRTAASVGLDCGAVHLAKISPSATAIKENKNRTVSRGATKQTPAGIREWQYQFEKPFARVSLRERMVSTFALPTVNSHRLGDETDYSGVGR